MQWSLPGHLFQVAPLCAAPLEAHMFLPGRPRPGVPCNTSGKHPAVRNRHRRPWGSPTALTGDTGLCVKSF